MTGVSPDDHHAADRVGAVVDVATGAARPRRRRPGPSRGTRADQPDAGAVGAVIDRPRRRRRTRRRPSSVRCSGAPCGPGTTRSSQSSVSIGQQRCDVQRRAQVLRAAERRARRRPRAPGRRGRRTRRAGTSTRLPSTRGTSRPPRDGEVAAQARAAATRRGRARRRPARRSTTPERHRTRRRASPRARRAGQRRSVGRSAKRSIGPRSTRLQAGRARRRCRPRALASANDRSSQAPDGGTPTSQ